MNKLTHRLYDLLLPLLVMLLLLPLLLLLQMLQVSKLDHCLYDLLLRHRSGELECEIPLVISNHPDTRHIAEMFGVEFRVLPIDKTSENGKRVQVRGLSHAAPCP